MAVAPYGIHLMKKGSGSTTTYTELVTVKTRPSLYGEPEDVEITTLADTMRQYIPGVRSNDAQSLEFNYDHTTFSTLKALEGTELDLALHFGGTAGTDGIFQFKGRISVSIASGGVNDPVNGVLKLYITSEITDAST